MASLIVLWLGVAVAAAAELGVNTTSGPVVGVESGGAHAWLGIPYSQSRAKDNRWKPPVAPHWDTPFLADRLGPACPQTANYGYNLTFQSEADCLTLNVWAPPPSGATSTSTSTNTATPSSLKPVFVFVHGGGNLSGAGSQLLYNSSRLVQVADMIVVTFNYRLGALGYFTASSLYQGGTAGNFGLLDQQFVLRWVHDNIAGFGGDPARVTLGGQSAGSQNVNLHVAFKGSLQYFGQILGMSGPVAAPNTPFIGLPFLADQTKADDATAEGLGCPAGPDQASCLRSLPVGQLVGLNAARVFSPVVDPVYFQSRSPVSAFKEPLPGLSAYMLGFLTLDTAAGVLFYTEGERLELSKQDVLSYLGTFFAGYEDKIAAQYGLETALTSQPSVQNFQILAEVGTDASYRCLSRKVAQLLERQVHLQQSLFLYENAHHLSFTPQAFNASHFMDLAMVWGNPCFITCEHLRGTFTRTEDALSPWQMAVWGAFVSTGSPGPAFRPYTSSADTNNVMGDTVVTQTPLPAGNCEFWMSLYPM